MKKMTLFSIVVLMLIMITVGFSYDVYAIEEKNAVVSKGLYVIAQENSMAVCGVSGNDVVFSPENFERAMNMERIDYIRINNVPDEAIGKLCIGSEGVGKGTVISRENLYKLSYVPKEKGVCENCFTFDVGTGYDIECSVYMLKELNYSPVASNESILYQNVSTHRNVSVYGTLFGRDSEGDKLTYEVISYPKNGIITILDKHNGEFYYTPNKDYIGNDSFEYVVRDIYGNYSSSEEININISKSKMNKVLSDMGGHSAHTSAITLIKSGIMSANEIDGKLVFAPNEKVTREDFLVMAMKASGLIVDKTVYENVDTDFADNEKISINAKPFVLLAQKKGIVNGISQDDKLYFNPKQIIKSSEAAVILDKIIDSKSYISTKASIETIFVDHLEIPVFAENSIRNLNYIGVLADKSGYIYPSNEVTRADAAIMLEKVIMIMQSNKKS